MSVKDIIPWRRKSSTEVVAAGEIFTDAFNRLYREINTMFDNFFSEAGLEPWGRLEASFSPRVDVVETDDAVKVSAELPGMEEKDIEVLWEDDGLVLKGEKKSEFEEKEQGWHRLERSYGAFYRRIAVPGNIDPEKIEARFNKGVLHITIPKTETAKGKSIKVKVS